MIQFQRVELPYSYTPFQVSTPFFIVSEYNTVPAELDRAQLATSS